MEIVWKGEAKLTRQTFCLSQSSGQIIIVADSLASKLQLESTNWCER